MPCRSGRPAASVVEPVAMGGDADRVYRALRRRDRPQRVGNRLACQLPEAIHIVLDATGCRL